METKEHIPEPMGQGSNQKVNFKKKGKEKLETNGKFQHQCTKTCGKLQKLSGGKFIVKKCIY